MDLERGSGPNPVRGYQRGGYSRGVLAQAQISSGSQRIPELDGLRGFAIFLVVLCHYIGEGDVTGVSATTGKLLRAFGFGRCGVDLFFVLSGFLIGSILLESRNSPNYYRTFYLRRVHRIFPLYYLWIVFYLIGIACLRSFSGYATFIADDLWHLPRYLFFVQNFFWSKTFFEYFWLGVTWSLAVEEQFYLVAPLLIRHIPGEKLIRVLVAIILLAPVLRFFTLLVTHDHYLVALGMPFRADTLAVGVLGAALWKQPEVRLYLEENPRALSWALAFSLTLVVGLLYWFYRPAGYVSGTICYSALAFLFLTLVLIVLSQPASRLASIARWQPVCWLGTVSYCVYIIHCQVLYGLYQLFVGGHPRVTDLKSILVTALAFILTCLLAAFSWRFFEKPFIRRGHRFKY
jgi:peptidoglycan/LPS O-acetylase OafA/YrhL